MAFLLGSMLLCVLGLVGGIILLAKLTQSREAEPSVTAPRPVDTVELARTEAIFRASINKARLALGKSPSFSLRIVGASFHQETLRALDDGRCERGETTIFTALMIPEPENPYGSDAILVCADEYGPVGHFSQNDAIRYREVSQELQRLGAIGVGVGHLVGGIPDVAPTIGVRLALKGPSALLKRVKKGIQSSPPSSSST
jgi:hypothetical protein